MPAERKKHLAKEIIGNVGNMAMLNCIAQKTGIIKINFLFKLEG